MTDRKSTIYVSLLCEGTDVWRPVEAKYLGGDRYLILSRNPDPDDETWQFDTGTIVRCREHRLSGGIVLVAFALAIGRA